MRVAFVGHSEHVDIHPSHPALQTSECLKLAVPDAQIELPLTPSQFTTYIAHDELHQSFRKNRVSIMENWKGVLKDSVSVIDTALRLCDIPTMEQSLHTIYLVVEEYCRPLIEKDRIIKSNMDDWAVLSEIKTTCTDFYLPVYYVLICVMKLFPGNSDILRDVVTHLPIPVVVHCLTTTTKTKNLDYRGPLQNEGAYFALEHPPTFVEGMMYGWDRKSLKIDTIVNAAKAGELSYVDQLRVKYMGGSEDMTPQDMCDFVTHLELSPYSQLSRDLGEESDNDLFIFHKMTSFSNDNIFSTGNKVFTNIRKLHFTTGSMPYLLEYLTRDVPPNTDILIERLNLLKFITRIFPGSVPDRLYDKYLSHWHQRTRFQSEDWILQDLDNMCKTILEHMRAMFDSFGMTNISNTYYFAY